MKIQRVEGRLDAVNLMREQSRDVFRNLPTARRIPNKKFKQPKYKLKYEEER
jgi:hypothetical protein